MLRLHATVLWHRLRKTSVKAGVRFLNNFLRDMKRKPTFSSAHREWNSCQENFSDLFERSESPNLKVKKKRFKGEFSFFVCCTTAYDGSIYTHTFMHYCNIDNTAILIATSVYKFSFISICSAQNKFHFFMLQCFCLRESYHHTQNSPAMDPLVLATFVRLFI